MWQLVANPIINSRQILNVKTLIKPSVFQRTFPIRNFKINYTNKITLGEKLILGGLGFGICSRRLFISVKCEAVNVDYNNRLAGFKLNDKNIKFDWIKFWYYLKPHIYKFFIAVVAALIVAYCNIKIPTFLGSLVNILAKFSGSNGNKITTSEFFQNMKLPMFNLFSIYVIHSLFTFLYILSLSNIGEEIATSLRKDLFQQIIIQDLSFFDKTRTGELVNRTISDIQEFKSCFKQFVSQGLKTVAQLIGGTITLFIISPKLATIALISVPSAVGLMSFMGQALRILSKQAQSQIDCMTSLVEEAYSNIRTVRSCAGEFTEIELFDRESKKVGFLSKQLGYGIAVFQALTNLFLNGLVATTLFLGGQLMSTSYLSPGDLMAFLVASQSMQKSLAQGSVLLGTLIKGMAAGSRVFEYLSLQPNISLTEGMEIPQNLLNGEIEFKNITFTYPSRPNHIVLKNFSLKIEKGQTVAIVGASGSGKSTFAALLSRFYEPDSGEILIDGYNLSKVSPNFLRGNIIGLIEQQPILFATTIFENIKYGNIKAKDDDIYNASKLSQSHDFIMNLPESYSTKVGERGAQLSGGQRQRIAIARAILKEPTILILDEATSALDASSEATVMQAMSSVTKNRTTIMIAHRLSTVKHADKIIVMKNGCIVETGTHNELMKKKGLYFELVKKQEKQQIGEQLDDL